MLTNYIKIAWKVLLRHPFYTFITLFGISLTLTVLMVLTSFIDHLFGTHYPESRRDRSLYIQFMVQRDSTKDARSQGPMSYRFLNEYVKSLKLPERVTINSFALGSSTDIYAGSQKIKITPKYTDAEFWQVMDFTFLDGKPYNEQTIRSGDMVAVITDKVRDYYFGKTAESVVGKSIEVENVRYRVIGVVKGVPVTRTYSAGDIYFPYTNPKSNYQKTGFRGTFVAVVLAKNKSDQKAIQEEFQSRIDRIPLPGNQDGFKYSEIEVKMLPYTESWLDQILNNGGGIRTIFYGILGFIVFMLLGLPALNLVNLNVSRILERASEIGVRKAFGAPISTLLWQFIVENIFITLIGGTIALLLSIGAIYLINQSGWIAYADLTINFSVLAISLLVCLLFGFLSGVLPAFRMAKLNIVTALKS
ncbi:ABC transporter permease [Spirosoma sp. KUDC1026]|uniref:ABC transporter permease n=1 Tax=Spirosoma sp. KUDC1026 TaxID=2745947 RepID=UPI00159BD000|nr:ABC transporter permease [Spirosoma sp. KUDC1026]QKZ11149.1 ABC transporter permease [Spirosoma sp. KUDC1026]